VAAGLLLVLLFGGLCSSVEVSGAAAVAVAPVAGEDCRHPVQQHGKEQRQQEGCNEQVSVALQQQLPCCWRVRLWVK
jgi:hypothetical protein